MSTVQIQNDIIDDFKILDGDLEMTLNYLMELGESLNDLDEKYKIDDNLVKGCQSKVWLKCTKEDDKIYLENAFIALEKKAEPMSGELKRQFLDFTIPKQIMTLYGRVIR